MTNLKIFLWEWKHFLRSPFKIIALILFMIASVYGLHKGADLYQKQKSEIEQIDNQAQKERQKIIDDHYRTGIFRPKDQPRINYSNPYWAISRSYTYHFKNPSPAIVYSIGQCEQYGFYKQITVRASPYDSDLAEEIANPERLQTGTLDFSFAILFLLPLVLLVLVYNLKSMETEQGFIPLVEVQIPSKNTWLFLRMSFYILVSLIIIIALLLYGASLTNVFAQASNSFGQILLYSTLYLTFWSVIYFLILRNGKSILGNTLRMSAVYLLVAFIIPATVHQYVSIRQPANLMTDFIDVRDERQALYDKPDHFLQDQLLLLFPELLNSSVYHNNENLAAVRSRSAAALVNELNKTSIQTIEDEYQTKNKLIRSTFWFNPVSCFQNRFNTISKTHFDDYQNYRKDIQTLIDKQIKIMVLDLWNEVNVDEAKYKKYYEYVSIK